MLKINLSEERKEPEASEALRPEIEPVPEGIPGAPEGKEPQAPSEEPIPPAPPEETAPPGGEGETPPDEGAPAPEEELYTTARRKTPLPEKIPLSSRDRDVGQDISPAPEEPVGAASPEPATSPRKGNARVRAAALAVFLVALAAYGVYTQRGRIAGLMVRKTAPVHTARTRTAQPAPAMKPEARADSTAPPAPESRPQPAPQPVHVSDPTISALGRIIGGTPARVWLTSVTVSMDGAYELRGMSFSHSAMKSFAAALKTLGTVTAETIPVETAAPDTAYTFGIAGKLSGVKSPEILDVIPPAQLAALGDTLKTEGKRTGIIFTRLPRANASYGDSDLPFEAEGLYGGIEAMLGELSGKGTCTVYRIMVRPAASGHPYNRVRASFSLRAISSI
jgi:hypothetical protein